jgi:hypothetical protein
MEMFYDSLNNLGKHFNVLFSMIVSTVVKFAE